MGRVTRAGAAAAALLWAGALAAGAGAQDAPDPPAAPPAAGAPEAPGAPVVAAFRARGVVPYGRPVPIRGRIAPAGRTRVALERLQGTRWVSMRVVATDARGVFAAELPLRRSASVRARALTSAGAGDPGPRRNVTVRRRASLSVTVHEHESIAGRPFRVSGAVVPARDGEYAFLEGSRAGRPYRPIARMRVRDGRVAGTFVPRAGGIWRFRLHAAGPRRGAPDRALSAPTAPRRVFDANPHRVPRSEPKYIVQKLSEAQLYYYEAGQLVRVLPVVFGKPSTPTPVGRFRVYSKTAGPGPAFGPLAMWYHGNYGIHGTNQEHLLARSWRYYSLGCTRNYNANIYWLWDRVPVGTPVLNLS